MQVAAALAEVEVEAVSQRHFVLSALQPHARSVGLVGITDIYAVERSADKSRHTVTRTEVETAVEALLLALVNHLCGDVGAKIRPVVTEHCGGGYC